MLFVNGVGQIVYWKNAEGFLDFFENLNVERFVKPNLSVNKHYINQIVICELIFCWALFHTN